MSANTCRKCGLEISEHVVQNCDPSICHGGLTGPSETLRDRFAMAAITGTNPGGIDAIQIAADRAYRLADAMLERRKK